MIIGNMPFGRTSIARPCVINDKFFCECGASHSRGPVLGGAASAYRCLACGITSHVNADSIFLAAAPGDSTSLVASDAAPLAADGGGAGEGSPDDARQQDAAAAVRVPRGPVDSRAFGTAPLTSADEAALMFQRAITDAMNARFLLAGGGYDVNRYGEFWYMADNLEAIAGEIKSALMKKLLTRPEKPACLSDNGGLKS